MRGTETQRVSGSLFKNLNKKIEYLFLSALGFNRLFTTCIKHVNIIYTNRTIISIFKPMTEFVVRRPFNVTLNGRIIAKIVQIEDK